MIGGWSPHVQTGFHVSRPTRGFGWDITRTGLSPTMAQLSSCFWLFPSEPLAWSAFARHY